MDLRLEGHEDEDPNTDPGNSGNGGIHHGENGAEDFSIGMPRGDEPGLRGNL